MADEQQLTKEVIELRKDLNKLTRKVRQVEIDNQRLRREFDRIKRSLR